MLKKHIFKANRGEGKTKWLVNKALDAEEKALEPLYLGSATSYEIFCHTYEGLTHHKCKIKRVDRTEPLNINLNYCLLTDEMMSQIYQIPYVNSNMTEGDWYITMSSEDFES